MYCGTACRVQAGSKAPCLPLARVLLLLLLLLLLILLLLLLLLLLLPLLLYSGSVSTVYPTPETQRFQILRQRPA